MRMHRHAEILEQLNSYTGDNIWEDVIYSLPYDERSTLREFSEHELGFVTTDGGWYFYFAPDGEWIGGGGQAQKAARMRRAAMRGQNRIGARRTAATVWMVPSDQVTLSRVEAYMPRNYSATIDADGLIEISGDDNAGWTLEDYVIPRLGSGMMRVYRDRAEALEWHEYLQERTASRKHASRTNRYWITWTDRNGNEQFYGTDSELTKSQVLTHIKVDGGTDVNIEQNDSIQSRASRNALRRGHTATRKQAMQWEDDPRWAPDTDYIPSTNEYLCWGCGEVFTSEQDYDTHRCATHEPEGQPKQAAYHEMYGEVTPAQLAAYRKHNISPSDHDILVDAFGNDGPAIVAEIKRQTANGGRFNFLDIRGGYFASRKRRATRKKAVSLTRIRTTDDPNVFEGSDPSGSVVQFRVTDSESADLRSILLSDLAINFTGVDVDESEIIREGSMRRRASGFWDIIRAQIDQLKRAKSASDVVAILGRDPDMSTADAFFGGGGGDDTVWGALTEAGWKTVWMEAIYYFAMQAPDGSGITYIEGDIYSEIQPNPRTASRKQALRRVALEFDDEDDVYVGYGNVGSISVDESVGGGYGVFVYDMDGSFEEAIDIGLPTMDDARELAQETFDSLVYGNSYFDWDSKLMVHGSRSMTSRNASRKTATRKRAVYDDEYEEEIGDGWIVRTFAGDIEYLKHEGEYSAIVTRGDGGWIWEVHDGLVALYRSKNETELSAMQYADWALDELIERFGATSSRKQAQGFYRTPGCTSRCLPWPVGCVTNCPNRLRLEEREGTSRKVATERRYFVVNTDTGEALSGLYDSIADAEAEMMRLAPLVEPWDGVEHPLAVDDTISAERAGSPYSPIASRRRTAQGEVHEPKGEQSGHAESEVTNYDELDPITSEPMWPVILSSKTEGMDIDLWSEASDHEDGPDADSQSGHAESQVTDYDGPDTVTSESMFPTIL